VSGPLLRKSWCAGPKAKPRALVVCGEAAVGLALQAVFTALLNLMATRR